MVVVQCKFLQIVHIPSKAIQCKTIDLISAHKLLQTAAEDIAKLRRNFDAVINKASTLLLLHGVCQDSFETKEQRKQRPTSMKYLKE